MKENAGTYLAELDPLLVSMPSSDCRNQFVNVDLVSKYLFNSLFGFTYEDFLLSYLSYPTPAPEEITKALFYGGVEVECLYPCLRSEVRRDSNGNTSYAQLEISIPINAFKETTRASSCPVTMILTVDRSKDEVACRIDVDIEQRVGMGSVPCNSPNVLARTLKTIVYQRVCSLIKSVTANPDTTIGTKPNC